MPRIKKSKQNLILNLTIANGAKKKSLQTTTICFSNSILDSEDIREACELQRLKNKKSLPKPPKVIKKTTFFKEIKVGFNSKKFVDLILKWKLPVTPCNHILIGSSQMEALGRTDITISNIHGRFSNYDEGFWKNAEIAFQNENKIIETQPRGRSWRLPFMCTTGDFIAEDEKGLYYAEIKSTKNPDNGYIHTNKRYLLQVWMTMEILGLERAKLVGYHTKLENKRLTVHKFFEMTIFKSVSLLNKKIATKLIDGYLYFLETYFKVLNVNFLLKDKLYAREQFLKCLKRTEKRGPTQNKLYTHCKYFSDRINKARTGYKEGEKISKLKKDKYINRISKTAFRDSFHYANKISNRIHSEENYAEYQKRPANDERWHDIISEPKPYLMTMNFDEENLKIMFDPMITPVYKILEQKEKSHD